MSSMSRRAFFLGNFASGKSPQCSHDSEQPRVTVGRITDFPIGEKKEILQSQMIIESLAEGFRARSIRDHNIYYSIESNQYGQLIVNCDILWSEDQVFSIFSNGPTCLEKPCEEQS